MSVAVKSLGEFTAETTFYDTILLISSFVEVEKGVPRGGQP
jgi:hypothetical protein